MLSSSCSINNGCETFQQLEWITGIFDSFTYPMEDTPLLAFDPNIPRAYCYRFAVADDIN